eukprot:GHRQ01006588.1.p1 GENE.GHRQ01006588.1~~GHRQ01006588.1.p1  ORF type:complete len:296 (+),score=89.45 GHRQ01006588.1:766-1653(+)
MMSLAVLSSAWLRSPWLLWGIGPVIASVVGFFVAAALLELLLFSSWCDNCLITYASSSNTPRKQLMAATHKRIPLRKQVRGCAMTLLGPNNIVNGMGLALLMLWAKPNVTAWMPGTAVSFLVQFVALSLVGDFGLYWGHRVQHESKLLWRLHSKHHAIDTPSPFSTLFIDPTDAALQGAIPFAFAALVVRPAPGVLYLYIAARIAENALNHSGIDSPLLDLLTLKRLPLRAPAAFHDAHHKYCNHAHKASNYGESFWLWDWAFGTLCPLSGRAASKAAAVAAAAAGQEVKHSRKL